MSDHLSDEDWIENKKFVLHELERLHSDLQTLAEKRSEDKEVIRTEIQQLGEKLASSQERLSRDIAVLKTKAGMWGAGVALAISLAIPILRDVM